MNGDHCVASPGLERTPPALVTFEETTTIDQALVESDDRQKIRRQYDLTLQKSEERYRAFVEHCSEAVWCVNIDPPCSTILSVEAQIDHFYEHAYLAECNDVMAQMFGFADAGRILGARMGNLLPRSLPQNRKYLRAFIESNYRLADEELEELDREGNTRCFLNNLIGIIEEGALARAWGTKRDISERKKAENALRESEERYERLVELSPDAIIVHTDGVVSFCNSATVRLVGVSSVNELIGRSVFDFIGPESNDVMRKRIASNQNGELLPVIEFRCLKQDGTYVDVEMQSVSFTSGNRHAIQAVVRDVSERKLAEAALKEANERAILEYERLVERIAVLGQTMGQARELETIFRALREFTVLSVPCDGMMISLYDPEDEVRRAAYCWVDGAERETSDLINIPVRDGLTGRALKSGSIVLDNEYQKNLRLSSVRLGRHEEGSVPESALTAPMTLRGRTTGCIEIQSYQHQAYKDEHSTAMAMAANLAATAIESVRLLDHERQQEERLRQSQKMEAIGTLAGGVAHDFNNLLTVILGNTELAFHKLQACDPIRARLIEVDKAAKRATVLTRQLLAFSRRQRMERRNLKLNDIVSETMKLLNRIIGADVEVNVRAGAHQSAIFADPAQIEQVVMNLAVNARDAMPEGGQLIIETSNITLDESYQRRYAYIQPGNYVELKVRDTGCGMDEETKTRLFEPFFTTKEVGKGTGLGLSMVYGIVKQHDGHINVYSELGHGTTFKIFLPAVEAEVEQEALPIPALVVGGQETILVAEDEEGLANLARDVLEELGYKVLLAKDGEEAVQMYTENRASIDMLLLDVMMPRIGGAEAYERIRQIGGELPLIFMTGYSSEMVQSRFVKQNILVEGSVVIQKPYSVDGLGSKVREVLDASPKKAPLGVR